MMADSGPITQKHIDRVCMLLSEAADELVRRGEVHDQSKFDPIEKGPLDEMQRLIDEEGPTAFGTPEYARRKGLLTPMLAHHYAANSHHPEHYADGVNGMDLFDLVEMFFDWKAASERDGLTVPFDTDIRCAVHKVEPQLASILKNTAERLGYTVS